MLLITQQEIVEMAFLPREKISPSSIRPLKIDIAQEHFIRPRFGDSMFDAMVDGQYADFVDRYIKAPLAHFVRYGVVNELAVQMCDNGAVLYSSTTTNSEDNDNKNIVRNGSSAATTQKSGSQNGSKTVVTSGEDNKTIQQNVNSTKMAEELTSNVVENLSGETVSSAPYTRNQTTTDESTKSENQQSDKTDQESRIESGDKSQIEERVQLHQATAAERNQIAGRALNDAKVLLNKAERYVEKNRQQYPLYVSSSCSQTIIF